MIAGQRETITFRRKLVRSSTKGNEFLPAQGIGAGLGEELGEQEVKESHPKLDWDQKRLANRDVNPFSEWAFYPPQPEIPEKMMKKGRPRKNN